MHKEIERRFLVRRLGKNMPTPEKIMLLQDSYFRLKGEGFRVRIFDDHKCEITTKKGQGVARDEIESLLKLGVAQELAKSCDIGLMKERLIVDGWELNLYKNPLENLIIAEKNLASVDEGFTIPVWLQDCVEITNITTSTQIAYLVRALKKFGIPGDLSPMVTSIILSKLRLLNKSNP